MGWTAPRTASNVPRWSLSKPIRREAVHGQVYHRAVVCHACWSRSKNVFQVHGVDAKGEVVIRRKLRRNALPQFFAKLAPCVVAMEACSSAHHWARMLVGLGHEIRLIPPAHVKPYVRRNKNDAADAAAICEAAMRPGQRFVPVRGIDNQAELMRHRARELLAGQRTSLINALRGHLAEIGVVAPQGAQHAYYLKRLAADGYDDDGEIVVPDCVRAALRPLICQIDALDEAIAAIDKELAASVKADETAKRLMTIPGVGPVTASAITATIKDMSAFASGREFAALLGLTPRQRSTGGKERLGRITKWATAICASFWWWAPARRFAIAGAITTPCAGGQARCSSARRSNTSSS